MRSKNRSDSHPDYRTSASRFAQVLVGLSTGIGLMMWFTVVQVLSLIWIWAAQQTPGLVSGVSGASRLLFIMNNNSSLNRLLKSSVYLDHVRLLESSPVGESLLKYLQEQVGVGLNNKTQLRTCVSAGSVYYHCVWWKKKGRKWFYLINILFNYRVF